MVLNVEYITGEAMDAMLVLAGIVDNLRWRRKCVETHPIRPRPKQNGQHAHEPECATTNPDERVGRSSPHRPEHAGGRGDNQDGSNSHGDAVWHRSSQASTISASRRWRKMKMLSKGVLLLGLIASLCAVSGETAAVALRPGKTTDPSVCDLGPNTTRFLGSQVLVPAVANSPDKIAAYSRLAGAFIVQNCTNSQLLILHGTTDVDSDRSALEEVANSSCRVADVRQTEARASEGPYSYGTFELRCNISKLDELKAKLQTLEVQDPFEALKARLAGSANHPTTASSRGTSVDKKGCEKLTLGTLMQGGACE